MPNLESDEYTINIKTVANTTGAKEATASLNNVQKGAKDVEEQSRITGGAFGGLVGQFALGNIAANAAVSAFGYVKNQFHDVFQAANDYNQTQAQLNAVLKSTHEAAGLNIQDLGDESDALARITTFSKEQIGASQALLLTFTDIRHAIAQEAQPAILNVATAMHEDLQSATVQVGKALNDPVTGLNALHRIGVTFNDTQKEMIKNFVATGDKAKAQQIILNELNKEFGGSAQAQAQTYAGRMQILKNNMDEAKASIGNAIEKGVQPLAASLASFVSTEGFSKFVKNMSDTISRDLPKAFKLLGEAIRDTIDVIKTLIEFYEHHREMVKLGIEIILAFVVAFKTVQTIIGIINAVKAAWIGLTALMEMNPIILIITAIIAIGLLLMMHWKQVSKVAEQIWHDVAGFFTGLWHDITSIFDSVVNTIKNHWQLILAVITGPVGLIVYFVTSHFQQILDFIRGIGQRIVGVVTGFGSLLFNAGKDIINGLIHGMESMVGAVTDKVKSIGKGIEDTAKKILKIFSPSHVFADIGINVGQGLIQGMSSTTTEVNNTSAALASSAITGANAALSSGPVTNNSVSTVNSSNASTTIGQIVVNTPEAAQALFQMLNNDTILARRGLTPVQGAL